MVSTLFEANGREQCNNAENDRTRRIMKASKGTILRYGNGRKMRKFHLRHKTVNGVLNYYKASYAREPEYFASNNFDYLLACEKIEIHEATYDDGLTVRITKTVEFTPSEFFAKIGVSESDMEKMKSEMWYKCYLNSNDYKYFSE